MRSMVDAVSYTHLDVYKRQVRYSELKQRMAHISDMALTNALKALQHAQIIDRRAYNEVPLSLIHI